MADFPGNPLYGLVLNTITASTWKIMRFLPNSETEMAATLMDGHDLLEETAQGDLHKAITVIRAHHSNYRRVYQTYLKKKDLCDRTLAQAMEDVG